MKRLQIPSIMNTGDSAPFRVPLAGNVRLAMACGLAAIATAGSALAAEVTLNAGTGGAGDAINTSSFATALNWSNSLAPATGNSYVVPTGRSLRTTLDAGTDLAFAGDSLSIVGSLIYKSGSSATNSNTVTIQNLSLNSGTVNNASNFSAPFSLAGNQITILGTGTSTLFANNGTITVTAPLVGTTGTLLLSANAGTAGRQLVLTAANTYTGAIQVGGLSGATLSPTGKLAFKIGANGVNNSITGAAPFVFEGAFTIDLTTAGNTVGNSWTLVDVSTVVETFADSFTIEGFTENFGFWTSADGRYQFNESTGKLTRIAPDTDGDGLPDAWEELHFGAGNLDEIPFGDFDQDWATNLLEYQSGTDPDDSASYPDADQDGLNDGWEIFFFNNIQAQVANGDPDADYNTNAVEYAAGSSPTSAGSYPDNDDGVGDKMNDGWEIHHFGSIAAAIPTADPDGDLYSNLEEFTANTDPKLQTSSPDSDLDGLPDGWEVKYFRVGSEGLVAAIARQDGMMDPDGDGYSNSAEQKAASDPTKADSKPVALAYWRFEEKTSGVVPYGNDAGGNQTNTVLDASGIGNHMMTWRNYTAPTYVTDVPFANVPRTAAANTASLAFVRDPANLYLTDNIYTTAGVGINSHVFSAYTIEASFKTTATNVWQVVVGKTGNPIGGQPPFSLKIRASDNRLVAGIVDGAGTAKEAVSTRAITTGTWFSAVVTASATELKLWIKADADSNPVLEATTPIAGAFYNHAGVNSPWVVGLGKWNNADADPFSGNIDEIRISPEVLAPSAFLVPVTSNDTDNDGMDDTWETASFGSLSQTATGDFDGDGTNNLTEYRLGLVANSGSSRFAAIRAADGRLSWPSVTGVNFIVMRSTTLAAGSWTPVGTVPGTAGTAGFTDPSPPVGGAFYRILLEP